MPTPHPHGYANGENWNHVFIYSFTDCEFVKISNLSNDKDFLENVVVIVIVELLCQVLLLIFVSSRSVAGCQIFFYILKYQLSAQLIDSANADMMIFKSILSEFNYANLDFCEKKHLNCL